MFLKKKEICIYESIVMCLSEEIDIFCSCVLWYGINMPLIGPWFDFGEFQNYSHVYAIQKSNFWWRFAYEKAQASRIVLGENKNHFLVSLPE